MTEADLQAAIRLDVGALPHARLFRNQVGEAWQGQAVKSPPGILSLQHARRVNFGLAPSSGDLIGWTSVIITPEMVGRLVAVFTSGEVKKPSVKHLPEDQQNWADVVLAAGGRAAMLRSVEDARLLTSACLPFGRIA